VLVAPEFHSTPRDELENEVTLWQLDNDPKYKADDGVINLLLKHLKNASDKKEAQSKSDEGLVVQYSMSIESVVDAIILSFGSAHSTQRLIEVELAQIGMGSRAVLSESGWFAPGLGGRNQVTFRSLLSAHYLNTKHDHMETFISPYPCFGSASYMIELPDSAQPNDVAESE
jgi:hypothetical protein